MFRKKVLPVDTSVRAEYEDGFILDETEHDDINPYDTQHNILRAIINKDPETEHGKMVAFSTFYNNQQYTVDWRGLPDNARPIRFRSYTRQARGGVWIEDAQLVKLEFGYQYNDKSGKNIKEVQEIMNNE